LKERENQSLPQLAALAGAVGGFKVATLLG
jgi:hypothetical protein